MAHGLSFRPTMPRNASVSRNEPSAQVSRRCKDCGAELDAIPSGLACSCGYVRVFLPELTFTQEYQRRGFNFSKGRWSVEAWEQGWSG